MTLPAASSVTTLYHKRRIRMERAKGLSHLVPAFVLLSSLLGVVSGREPFTWLTGLEVLVGAAYVVLLVREVQHSRHHGPTHHEPIAWLELAAAGILGLEGYHIWHQHHETALRTGHEQFHVLPWLYFALALWYVVLTFTLARLYERRRLHLHPAGFAVRLHPFRKLQAFAWSEIARLEPQGTAGVLVHYHDGRQKRLSFNSIHDGPAHRDRLLAHAAATMKKELRGADAS